MSTHEEQKPDLKSSDDFICHPDGSQRDPLELALSQFTEEIRLGRSPSVEEFAARFPALADQIRELFPLIGGLERWKGEKEVECLKRNIPKKFSFDRLGEYQIVRELGRGGMGVVFQAFHITTMRAVAIKLLPWKYADKMSVWKNRLQREAVTIAALQHSNIVPIYSFSEDQGYPYYVMQLVEGIGLDKIIHLLKKQRENPSFGSKKSEHETTLTLDSWRGFAKIAEQVALALAYAHERDVLHNDVKPSNLIVRPNGQVIVTDFGIGHLQHEELSESDDHSIGTLKYMAPERLDGTGDSQSDIYSLGVTLYELATQTPIFDVKKRSRLIDAIHGQEPPRPRTLFPEIPLPLESIILKAMAKVPANRYSSARTFAEDLRRFINRQPIWATSQGIWQRAITWLQERGRRQKKRLR